MSVVSPATSRPVTLRITLACNLAEVWPAVQNVRSFLSEQGWDDNSLIAFDLALVEGCNNAVKYADDRGRDQAIIIEAISEAMQVEFRIHDNTAGFEWPKKAVLPDPESESGRGIYLITSLMDYVGYFRGVGENILVMRKERALQEPSFATSNLETLDQFTKKIAENERMIAEMVEELSSCYESLSAIFRYSTEQGKTGNLREFARQLLTDLLQIASAEWFILRLVPKGESRLAVFAASEPLLELEPLLIPATGNPPYSMEVDAAMTCQRVWFNSTNPVPADGLLHKYKPGSAGLVQPILFGGQLMGTLTLGRTLAPVSWPNQSRLIFTAGQTNVVSTFADFLAIQVANARFQEEQFHRRLVTHELEIANNIQRSLLPTTLPQLPSFTLAAFCRSAHEVGGDFYDVLRVSDHSVLLVIADVMGKGIPAAMFAAILRTLLRAVPEYNNQPGALLTRVNRLLYPELSAVDMFITAQLAFVDAHERKMITASAGHCPLVVATTKGVTTFSPEGMPLGILPDTIFQDETVELSEKCRVLLYTDGLTEALSAKGEYFGQQPLLDWLEGSTKNLSTADQLKEELARELEKYQANTTSNDDQTFIIMAG
ncbi:SpoIIE family protein phosphatase [Pedosphaera parvula]|uniref:Protein serine/threonine phosphatase n=1 Tax=Pedosphaera parvula (strain Ellin514) TaxID=320771 RepID=B9XCG3_PEDPL|nr:SpoIIE family protein phosphatase [Pedosphaera parvula]EEF62631.1 protein serine/threonine phosphatase [Pedosphaera parvula Ellin514]